MLIIILILAVMDAVVAVFGFHVGYDTSIIEMLFATGNETMTTVLCLVWMIYVNYRLYHSRDYIMRRFLLVTMPLIIILVLTMVSSVIFHGTGVIKAAWITAVFFFSLHMQYPLFYMTGALLLCLVTGVLYEKNRNIWGAVLIHFAIGFLPRCLGVLQILEGYPAN